MGQRDGRSSSLHYPPVSGFWVWDVQRNRIYGDLHLSSYFRLTEAQFAHGATLEQVLAAIHAGDRERIAAAIAKAVETGQSYGETYRVSAPDGDRVLRAEGRCHRDVDGKPSHFPGWFIDITGMTDDHATLELALYHVEQARVLAGQARNDLLTYLIDNVALEVEQELEREGGGGLPSA